MGRQHPRYEDSDRRRTPPSVPLERCEYADAVPPSAVRGVESLVEGVRYVYHSVCGTYHAFPIEDPEVGAGEA